MTTVNPSSENPSSDGQPPGFTLMEVLLAVTILGFLLTAVYGAVSRTLNSKQIAESRAELFATGREAVLKMGSDIETAMRPKDQIIFIGKKGGGKPATDSIDFVMMNRGAFGYSAVRPGPVLVTYWLSPLADVRGTFALIRDEQLYQAILDQANGVTTQAADPAEEDPRPISSEARLVDCPNIPGQLDFAGSCLRVAGLQFSYYDDLVRDWRDEWDSMAPATLERLPAAVRIVLSVTDGTSAQDFTTVVDLPVARGQPTPVPGQTPGEGEGFSGP